MFCKYKIADFKVEFDLEFDRTMQAFSDFSADFDIPDFKLQIPDEVFERERDLAREEYKMNCHNKMLENTAAFRVFAEKIPFYDSVVFHSCAFEIDGKGIALTARSGTGKTTHMLLWQQILGDKFHIVNGDKPILRFINDELYMYGTPWAGKEKLYANVKSPLTDICQIVRSETNKTVRMSKEKGVELLMRQIYMPHDVSARLKTLQLISKIADTVNFWQISCNMEPDAAKVAYNAIFNA